MRANERRRGARGAMRAVLFATAVAGLAACGGGGDGAPGTIATQPLAGKIGGQPWTFVAGQTDAFLSGMSDNFFATLFDKPFASPCVELRPQDATHSLILNIPKAVGHYAISLTLNQTFSYPQGASSTQNDIATSGTLEVTELTATSLSGGVKMAYGTQDSGEGQFMITICAP